MAERHARWYEWALAIAIGVPLALVLAFIGGEAQLRGDTAVGNWIGLVGVTICLVWLIAKDHRWALARPRFLLLMGGLLLVQLGAFILALRQFPFEWRAPTWGGIFFVEFIAVSMALERLGFPAGGKRPPRQTPK